MLLIVLLLVSVALIVLSTSRFRFHPFLALLFVAVLYGLASGMPLDSIVDSINRGFGGTIGQIGIVIIAGSDHRDLPGRVGRCLCHGQPHPEDHREKAGTAYHGNHRLFRLHPRLCRFGIRDPLSAEQGTLKKAKISLAGSASALVLGLSVTHVLVPPTPGPIAAAGILEADLGLVIMLGVITSIPVLVVAWLYGAKDRLQGLPGSQS